MSNDGSVVVVGGTRAIGFEIVRHYVEAGRDVVLTGRDPASVAAAVGTLGDRANGLTFDLADPGSIAPALTKVGPVRHLVLAAIDRDSNSVKDYDLQRALSLVTLKLVVHALHDRLTDDASLVLFGGMAKERPYPGSTTVSTVNGGVVGMTRTLVEELRPRRANSIHPGIVGDTPYWSEKPAAIARYTSETPTGRLAETFIGGIGTNKGPIVGAVVFLLENPSVNGVELIVDGGWHCR